jgi:hypothetical protein
MHAAGGAGGQASDPRHLHRDRDVLLRGQDQHSAAVSGQKLALALAPGSLSLSNNVDRPTVG